MKNNNQRVCSFHELLSKKGSRDIVLLTELGGASGEQDIRRTVLRGPLADFDAVYSQKPMSKCGSRPGGGILLLARSSLYHIRDIANTNPTTTLDGHLRSWLLVRKDRCGMVIITICYTPPPSKKKSSLRDTAINEILSNACKLSKQYKSVPQLVYTHLNNQDGCIELLTNLESTPVITKNNAMSFERRGDTLVYVRRRIDSLKARTTEGKAFSQAMAELNLLPISSGTPSTWQLCGKNRCKSGCSYPCERGKRRGANDTIYINSSTLLEALKRNRIKISTERLRWDPKIDHSVVYLKMKDFFGPPVQLGTEQFNFEKAAQRRFQFPRGLLEKYIFLKRIARCQDTTLINGPPKDLRTLWELSMSAVTTSNSNQTDDMNFLRINVPGEFWRRQNIMQIDKGKTQFKMSLLKGLYNPAGEFITLDSNKIALFIKMERQKVVSHGKMADSTINKIKEAQEYLETERTSNFNESSQDCLNGKISEQEIKLALSKLKDVGPGLDGIPPISVVGHIDHNGCSVLKKIEFEFNQVFDGATIPTEWSRNRLLLLYKGKNLHPQCCESYRGIGISTAMLKIISLILEERITQYVEQHGLIASEQLGFRRCSGTQEAVLTLSELLKSGRTNSDVYAAFIDIKLAYDSVQWDILFAKLLSVGIKGKMLSFLRRIYLKPTQTIEVDGSLVGTIDMQMGLLQGSSLSPILFNLYINSTITTLTAQGCNSGITSSRRSVQFFADDGVLLSESKNGLVSLLGVLEDQCREMNMALNKEKTKVMVFPKFNTTRTLPYQEFEFRGTIIETVQEFEYLGTMFNTSGNWELAWKQAESRGRFALHQSRTGGFNMKGSLYDRLLHCKAKVLCYFDTLMAIAGSSGNYYKLYDKLIDECLLAITKYKGFNKLAARAESGLFLNVKYRGDILMVRLFAKICAIGKGLVFDIIMSSIKNLTESQKANPEKLCKNGTFALELLSAIKRLGISPEAIYNMNIHTELCLFQVKEGLNWKFIPRNFNQNGEVRIVPATGSHESANFYDKNSIPLTENWKKWSVVKPIVFAALRAKGNKCKVKDNETLRENFRGQGYLGIWAALTTGSFIPSYWYIVDGAVGLRTMRVRLDWSFNEDAQRRRPCRNRKGDIMPRLCNKSSRVCYLCTAQTHDSLYHRMYSCPSNEPELIILRSQLEHLAQSPGAKSVSNYQPNFSGNLIFVAIMLSNRVSGRLVLMEEEIIFPVDEMKVLVCWLTELQCDHNQRMNSYHEPGSIDITPGAILVHTIARYISRLSSIYRRATRNSDEYQNRIQDPRNLDGI